MSASLNYCGFAAFMAIYFAQKVIVLMKNTTRKIITCLAVLVCSVASAQNEKYTLSGQIKDASNGEDMPFANVVVTNLSGVGVTSNEYGFYSISLAAGEYDISFQLIGYESVVKHVSLTQNVRLDVEMGASTQQLAEVVISDQKENVNVTRNDGSVTKIDIKAIKEIPALGGEPDVMKVIQTTPGIKTAGEGNSGFYVRGGGLDQNLILLDEAPVYNPSHLLGIFSVFNGDALKSTEIYKGGMSAKYGGRTASVMDIRMKDGNSKQLAVTGGIGLIASRVTVEAPIVKNKGSFMISGRRTYADLFLQLSNDDELSDNTLFFHDLNLKANYRLGDKDKLYLSGYYGRDKLGIGDQIGFDWGNVPGTLRWNHIISDKLFSNTSLILSNYDYNIIIGSGENKIELESVIADYNLKQDFTYYLNNDNNLKFGINAIHHTVEPGNLTVGPNTGFTSEDATPSIGVEGAVYLQNEQKITTRLQVNYGLRYSFLQRIGEGDEFTLDGNGNVLAVETFDANAPMEFMGGFEPRLSANYSLDEFSSLKLGLNRNLQYIHLLTNATTSTPIDTWIMSSKNVRPQIAEQVSLGYYRNFRQNTFEASAEVYYKDMDHVIDYRNGANAFFNDEIEADLVSGDGDAYGIEFYLKKNKGKLTGWVSYTLSRTTRQFDEINNGERFSARQDRTHDIAVVAAYKLSDRVTLSGNYTFYTGDAVTFPSGQYSLEGSSIPAYGPRNDNRMPNYHRMDFGLTWKRPQKGRFESSWNFSVYNVYLRENPYIITFQENEDDPSQNEAIQLSLFKIVPSVTYNFSF